MRASFAVALVAAMCLGCGPKPPPRYVIESDLAGYHYRRYQKVLDVELPVAENPATGHTATYVHEGDPPKVVPVFVTAYERADGLAETIRKQLRGLESYELDVRKLARENIWQLRGESGDVWMLWISGRALIKIGAPEGDPSVPSQLVEAYLERYPSDLDRKGHTKRRVARDGEQVALRSSDQPKTEATE